MFKIKKAKPKQIDTIHTNLHSWNPYLIMGRQKTFYPHKYSPLLGIIFWGIFSYLCL